MPFDNSKEKERSKDKKLGKRPNLRYNGVGSARTNRLQISPPITCEQSFLGLSSERSQDRPMAHTLKEVAQLAGVSRSTVSRVVNDYLNVQPETRERVWEAIRKSGYQPHAIARSLVTKRTRIIGMVIPEAVTTLFTDPAQRLHQRAYHLQHSRPPEKIPLQ